MVLISVVYNVCLSPYTRERGGKREMKRERERERERQGERARWRAIYSCYTYCNHTHENRRFSGWGKCFFLVSGERWKRKKEKNIINICSNQLYTSNRFIRYRSTVG